MSTTFRVASEADLPRLAAMTRELYAGEGMVFPARADQAMRNLIDNPHYGRCMVVESDGSVVGYLVIGFGFSLEFGGRDAFLDELYLVPEARGAGIGKAAVAHAARFCASEGISALHLEVSGSNLRGQKLYRGMGFSERHAGYDVLTLRLTDQPA
jgi:ribosomal protein S18 acetylase RimI-like enzyme